MNETRILDTLRAMAWERVKGELRSMLVTFYDDEKEYARQREAIEEFIVKMEDELGV